MIYVPILKGKEGEFAALEVLGFQQRVGLVPLIEMPAVPFDHAKEEPAKSIDAHLNGYAARIRDSWRDGPVLLDLSLCEDDTVADGRNPLSVVLADCATLGVNVRPVIGTQSKPAYIAAAKNFVAAKKSGACIRLKPSDFDEDGDLHGDVERLLKALHIGARDVDLVVDLGALHDGERSRNVTVTRAWLGALPIVKEWRTVILAATSFPPDLSDVDAQTIERLPRREWELWETLQRRPKMLPRQDLVYSDYGISHPTTPEIDPRLMRMSASIRYTAEACWLVVKGRNVRQHGFEQYFELCRRLIQEPEYQACGRHFSWGDAFIWNCAHEAQGPGNATTWRKVGTNHHLTLVHQQLSSVGEP